MIGGNKELILKAKTGNFTTNSIGERIPEIIDYAVLRGFLDLSTENTKHTTFNAKIQESDYIFICDYAELSLAIGVKPATNQLIGEIDGKKYDVLLIDNVMELNKHYEIYLRYVGD